MHKIVLNEIHELKWIKWCEFQLTNKNKRSVLSFSFLHPNEMRWDDDIVQVWWFHVESKPRTSISFLFCNDADVIGVNLIPFLVLHFLFLLLFVSFVDDILLCRTFKNCFFCALENVRIRFFFVCFMRILIYSLLFRVLNSNSLPLVCPLFRSLAADILVSMQILSKFAVNYVLCIFTSVPKKNVNVFVVGFILLLVQLSWCWVHTVCYPLLLLLLLLFIRIIELALKSRYISQFYTRVYSKTTEKKTCVNAHIEAE